MSQAPIKGRISGFESRDDAQEVDSDSAFVTRRAGEDTTVDASGLEIVQETPNAATVNRLVAQHSSRELTKTADNGRAPSPSGAKKSGGDARITLLQTQCLKLSLAILSRPNRHARSLGFTSAIGGEGKSFLASLTASALTERTRRPVTLVDCNWDDPALHKLYDVPATPGLAEWLRQECSLEQIRYEVAPSLTVIPAGDALHEGVALTDALKSAGALTLIDRPDEALIVDMAPVLTTPYSALLAQQLDAVLLVVRAGVTWDSYVQEACQELGDAAVEGVVLNATRSRIPRWLQRLL